MRVSVDHPIKVVASDGYEIHPEEAESVIVNGGERWDFVIEANQLPGNYWARVAETLVDEWNDDTHTAAVHERDVQEDGRPYKKASQKTSAPAESSESS